MGKSLYEKYEENVLNICSLAYIINRRHLISLPWFMPRPCDIIPQRVLISLMSMILALRTL